MTVQLKLYVLDNKALVVQAVSLPQQKTRTDRNPLKRDTLKTSLKANALLLIGQTKLNGN